MPGTGAAGRKLYHVRVCSDRFWKICRIHYQCRHRWAATAAICKRAGGFDSITIIPFNANSLNGGTYQYYYALNQVTTPENEAIYLGRGGSFTHNGLAFNTTYHYYVRSINAYGVSGFYHVSATTDSSAENILQLLAGQIAETELAAELASVIDLITAPASTSGSVDARILTARSALEAQINTISAQLADITTAPDYDNAETYAAGDLVKYNGGLYSALQATTGNLPSDPAYWEKIGDYASLGEAVSALAVELDELTTRVQSDEAGLAAEAERVDGIFAQINPPMSGETGWYAGSETVLAGVWSEQYARASDDGALSSRIDTVLAQAQGNAAAITAEATSRATADSALAQQITTLTATVEGISQLRFSLKPRPGHQPTAHYQAESIQWRPRPEATQLRFSRPAKPWPTSTAHCRAASTQ
ncbi:hypothetical protein ACFSVK_02675 [Azorhizophilus paspali]|uniref:phage tail tip protein J-related protein n=1 Tax=Azorhizophilus paspali TaxID=69963 RepID=UPI0036444EA8